MQTSWRSVFLIVVAAGALGLATWKVFLVVFGYMIFENLDQWLAKRARTKAIGNAIDYVLFGWETDPNDAEHEEKDQWSRVRLTGKDQIIVARIADLLREALR